MLAERLGLRRAGQRKGLSEDGPGLVAPALGRLGGARGRLGLGVGALGRVFGPGAGVLAALGLGAGEASGLGGLVVGVQAAAQGGEGVGEGLGLGLGGVAFGLGLGALGVVHGGGGAEARAEGLDGVFGALGGGEDGAAHGLVGARAGDLLEDAGALVVLGREEAVELALGEEDGALELAEVHPQRLLDQALRVGGGVRADVGVLAAVEEEAFDGLQVFGAAALLPTRAEAALGGLEGGLGPSLRGAAGHHLVGRLGDVGLAGRAAVERQADGVQQGGLPRAGLAGDEEEAVLEGLVREVHRPRAGERVEVREAHAQQPHRPTPPTP